jgi:hypothetical protein
VTRRPLPDTDRKRAKGGGRKPATGKKRTHNIHVLVDDHELATIDAARGTKKRGPFVRDAALDRARTQEPAREGEE